METKHEKAPMIFGGYFRGVGKGIFLMLKNIGWRIEQAVQEPANPLLEPKYPWDTGMFGSGHGTVLKDPIDGLFKAWLPSIEVNPDYGKPGVHTLFRLTYAYSEDGVNWIRPELDICQVLV